MLGNRPAQPQFLLRFRHRRSGDFYHLLPQLPESVGDRGLRSPLSVLAIFLRQSLRRWSKLLDLRSQHLNISPSFNSNQKLITGRQYPASEYQWNRWSREVIAFTVTRDQ